MAGITLPGWAYTFPAAASSGIVAFSGVVLDPTTHGNVKLPATTPELTFAGFADINGVQSDGFGSYNMAGIATAISDGSAVINPGDALVFCPTSNLGDVKTTVISIPASPGTQGNWSVKQVLGTCVNRAQVPATLGSTVAISIAPYIVTSAP